MTRIGSWLFVRALGIAAFLVLTGSALDAQGPTFVFTTVGGSAIPNNTVYYTSQQQIKVSICHSSYLQSYSASLTNSSGWSSVTLQDGLQASCTGEGFLAEITLAPGSNTLFADATDGSWNYGSDEVTVIYVLPSHARVIAPGDGGVRVMPGTLVELPFTVVNAGSAPSSFKVTVSCTGPFSSCIGPFAKGTNYVQTATLPVSGSATVMLKATAGSATGTGQLRAIATPDGGGVADTASTPLAITSAPIPPPEVRRARDSVIVAASVSRTAQFKVTNPDPFASRTVTLSIPAGGCGTLSSCTPSPSSVSLGPQRDTTITVTFTTPGSFQTTKVVLLASASSPSHAVRDSTWVTIGNPPTATVAVNVADHNAGPSVARDQCLSVAAGPGAGIECGSLRLAHGMRGVRTLGVDRAPTLVYLSRSANPMMLIAARVSVANHVLSLPADSLKTTLTVGGVPHTRAWPWSAACASGTGCRIAVPLDAQSLATGLYDYSLEVRIGSGGGAPVGTATGKLAVVNDRQSVWGAGWWLEGLERLVPMGADSVFWIGGDGSTRLYTRQSSTVFTVPASARLDRHDTLTTNGSTWARRIRNGATVAFDASYRHVSTTNRQGHQTTFYYHSTSTRLDSIEVPVPASTRRVFRFLWDTTASPIKLTKILLPSQATGAAVDTFTVTLDGSRRVTALRSPGDSAVTFTYSGGSFLPLTRVDRMANPTTYTYDAFGAVTNVSLAMGGSPSIQTKLCAAETRSLVSCAIDAAQAVPISGANEVTLLDGPRSDVVDWTRFFVNRLGAPDTIVDALGGRTRIRRDNGSFPALVTQVTDPAGLVSSTAYNSRGLPDSSVVHAPYGGANAVTKYKWDPKWDMLVSMRAPTGELDTMSIGWTTGNRMWQQRGTSSTRRVEYGYDAYNRLELVWQGAVTLMTLTYESALGNVWKSQTALGYTTEMLQNAIGADTLIWTPTDSAGTPALRTKYLQEYDALGRVVSTRTTASAQDYTLALISSGDTVSIPAKTQVVETEYDAEGRVKSVHRYSSPYAPTASTSSFVYDKAGRVTSQTETGSSGAVTTVYDAAGNAISITSRRGLTTTMSYDALGRVVTRVTPRVTYPRVLCAICHNEVGRQYPQYKYAYDSVHAPDYTVRIVEEVQSTDLVIPTELTVYAYDAGGRMVQADNPFARVRRGYYPNGALKADTSWTRDYDIEAYTLWPTGKRSILSFSYDLSGRRTERLDHQGGRQTYGYDSVGQMERTTDRATLGGDTVRVTFGYDARGRLTSQSTPVTGEFASWGYDDEDRPTSRSESEFTDAFRYDARGKRVYVSAKAVMLGTPGAFMGVYDGLGQLIASASTDTGIPVSDEITIDALGNALVRNSNRIYPIDYNESLDTATYVGHRLVARAGTWYPHGRTAPGHAPSVAVADSLEIGYDHSGNVTFQQNLRVRAWTTYFSGDTLLTFDTELDTTGHTWKWNYYDGAERLRFAQRTLHALSNINQSIFEEYWYDALGRRVLVRTRVDSTPQCPSTEVSTTPIRCQQQVLNSAWDGDQLLFERRTRGGWQRGDQFTETIEGGDWWGKVRYTHSGPIDAPLLVWKDGANPRIVHRNWRGNAAGATFALTGSIDSSTVWPAALTDVWLAPDADQTLPEPTSWLGSLTTDQRDATGTLYRRNRYYDPVSGRFTQEDPIGLAGGLNLYGYAAGDPVNLRDPFGLCPDSVSTEEREECEKREAEDAAKLREYEAQAKAGCQAAVNEAVASGIGDAFLAAGGWAYAGSRAVGRAAFAGRGAGAAGARYVLSRIGSDPRTAAAMLLVTSGAEIVEDVLTSESLKDAAPGWGTIRAGVRAYRACF